MVVRIEPWGEDDLDLLRRTNTPEMTGHLGGPESAEKIVDRHKKYLTIADEGTGRMFRIVVDGEPAPVGSIGYWDRVWLDEPVYEAGWKVLPGHQGKGIAKAATLLAIDSARAERKHRYLHAYPSVDNPASNGVCRAAGMELMGEYDFEYPPGNPLRCNDWRVALW